MSKQAPLRPEQLTPNVKAKSQEDLVREFLKRYSNLKNELDELKGQIKDLEQEFEKQNVDIKTLKKVMRVIDIMAKVQHKGTYDRMFQQLENELVKSAA